MFRLDSEISKKYSMLNSPDRRRFLQQLALLGGGMALPFGCRESIPDDIKVARIVQFEFRGKRPKYVGKNSRLDDHTEFGRDRGILVFTDNGLTGIGTYWGDKTSLEPFLGKSLLDWYDEAEKKFALGEGNRGTMAFWDVLARHHEKPLWQLLGEEKREKVPLYDGTIYFQDLLPQFAGNYMNQFGIEGIMAEAAIGKPFGARVAPHNWGSMLGYYCLLHLGKVIDNWYQAEQDALTLGSITPLGYDVKDGFATVSEAPGLGLEIDVEAFMKEAEIREDLRA